MSATEHPPLLVERDGPVATLTMNVPERRNALGVPMRAAFVEALEELEADGAIRAAVVTGTAGVFSSGGDLAGMEVDALDAARERMRRTHKMIRLMVHSRLPLIAAVEGWCVGAGLSVLCACDHAVAAGDALFRAPFAKVGLIPDLGLLHTLPRRIGFGHARELLLFGETIDARRAHEIGLVDRLCAPGEALAEAKKRALVLAELAPLSLAFTKAVLAEGLEEALAKERELQAALFMTADHAEGKRAFLEKRAPTFRGK
ncbi:enoyl-CoA hydratase/isomerase family protein [Elioraea sp.]|jgi:2-(1,2-epoxy-1,2-dihydrophenyl)acetyl-CoA isomerase|uniref:enoyl-CoA hydratase/isomerase family protein n=1 Tax=Elioraea sp. TaxID=2185103 RepID=UPI003F722DE2